MSTLEDVPGGLTESTPGQTDRVAQALSKAQAIPAVALDVPVVEAEVIPELDADAARVLDTEIRRLSAQISGQLHQVRVLLDEAQTGMIHKVLGFPSWTAYAADALSGIRLALFGDDRRDIVQLLAEAGMSVRAIETATGVPKSTVARDLSPVPYGTPASPSSVPTDEESEDPPARPPVTGLDGKTYSRSDTVPKPKAPNYTGDLTPILKTLRKIPDQANRLRELMHDDQFRAWVRESDSRMKDVDHEIEKVISALKDLQGATNAARAVHPGPMK